MLTPCVGRARRTPSPRRPGASACPAPTIETLPISSCVRQLARRPRRVSGSSAARAVRRSSRGTVNEISACPPAETGSFWTIMSTLTFAAASASKMRAAAPGLVGDADQRDPRLLDVEWVTAVISGCSIVSPSATTTVPGSSLEGGPAVDPHAVVAGVLDRAQLQHARARGGHLEHLLEGDRLAACARRARSAGRPNRRRRRPCRSRRPPRRAPPRRATAVVSEPPRPSVVTLRGVLRDALEAGDQHDLVLLERRPDAVGAHVEDPRLGVRVVGDDPRLRAGQRDRPVAEVVDRHRAQRARDPLAGGQQHVHLARVGRAARPPRPSRSARRSSCPARTAPRRRGGRLRACRRSAARRA